MLICLSVSAYCQDDKIVIGFNCQVEPPTMTLIEGEGNLYHYAGQFQKYRGIYYLFTDMSTVKITSSSKLYKGLKMMFNTYDDKSEWLLNDGSDMPEGNSAVITQKMIDEGGGAMFRWEERAHLLISASDRNKEDPKHTLFLIVLPMPPDDILFSEVIPSLKVDKDSCTISGNVTIYRTGRW